jgi:hypothetical protein
MRKLILLGLTLVAAAYFGSRFFLHYRVSSVIDNAILMAAPFADIEYDGVSSTIRGELSIEGITLQMHEFRDPLTIDKLRLITPGYFFLLNMGDIGQPGQDFDIPDRFGVAVDGVRASVSSDYLSKFFDLSRKQQLAEDAATVAAVCTGKYGFAPQTLLDLGYADLELSMSMRYRQDQENLFLDVTADIVDMYRMNITVQLADRLTQESLIGGRYRPRLAEGRLEYFDLSLRERTVALCARQGLSESEIRAAQIDAFAAGGLENGLEFDEYVLEPYREFLDGKPAFVLTAKPNEPISFSQLSLYKPADVPALLNLEGDVL